MNDPSLPVEILEAIFEDMILEYTKEMDQKNFLPRWYLLPLLRVCKLWYMISERYLYRSISIGSKFPRGETQIFAGKRTTVSARDGYLIASALLVTLKANSRLATLVEELQIRISHLDDIVTEHGEGIHTQLVDICPNLLYVDLRKVHLLELDGLSESLMKKSLVSFRISLLSSSELISFPIFALMQRWPKIRKIRVEGNYSLRFVVRGQQPASQASDDRNFCPELREIILIGGRLHEGHLKSLRNMCSGVTKLGVYVAGFDDAAFDELCGCLQAWSPTFEWFSLYVTAYPTSYPPLSETLASLRSLQELQVCNFMVDIGAISGIPQLKRLCHTSSDTDIVMDHLSNHLEDPTKFTSLRDIAVYDKYGQPGSDNKNLRDACHKRNIKLQV